MKEEDVKYIEGVILKAKNDALARFITTPERVKTLGLEADDMCYKLAELAKEELERRNQTSEGLYERRTDS